MMRTRSLAGALTQYAVLTLGQAVIGYAVQQGVTRVAFELEQRKRRRNRVGF